MDGIRLPEPLNSIMAEIEPRAITNFYGEPGTGKTNLCLLAALRCIEMGGKVIFIDSEGGFSLERVKQLADDYRKVLESIKLFEPKDLAEQGRMIRGLQELREGFDMIIVDSMVALYRLEYSEPGKEPMEFAGELSKQMSILSTLAREKNIPVVITAHTFRNWDTGSNEIIGGDSIKYWSKAILFIEKTGRMSERRATVVKHRSIAEDKNVKFMICDSGIRPAGFKLF